MIVLWGAVSGVLSPSRAQGGVLTQTLKEEQAQVLSIGAFQMPLKRKGRKAPTAPKH